MAELFLLEYFVSFRIELLTQTYAAHIEAKRIMRRWSDFDAVQAIEQRMSQLRFREGFGAVMLVASLHKLGLA